MQKVLLTLKTKQMRDKISNKYYKMAEGTELDEALKHTHMVLRQMVE